MDRIQAEDLLQADLLNDGITDTTWAAVLSVMSREEAQYLLEELRAENADTHAALGSAAPFYGVAAVRARSARDAIRAGLLPVMAWGRRAPLPRTHRAPAARSGLGRRTSSGQRRTRAPASAGDDGPGEEPPPLGGRRGPDLLQAAGYIRRLLARLARTAR